MIWAVIRSAKVEAVTCALKNIGVTGCTISRIRGYGEEWHLYEPLVHGGHHKLETIVSNEEAERVVSEIEEIAWTGLKGDGVVSVLDVGKFTDIRSSNPKMEA